MREVAETGRAASSFQCSRSQAELRAKDPVNSLIVYKKGLQAKAALTIWRIPATPLLLRPPFSLEIYIAVEAHQSGNLRADLSCSYLA